MAAPMEPVEPPSSSPTSHSEIRRCVLSAVVAALVGRPMSDMVLLLRTAVRAVRLTAKAGHNSPADRVRGGEKWVWRLP